MLTTLATVSGHLAPDPGGTHSVSVSAGLTATPGRVCPVFCSQVWQEVAQLCGCANNGTVRSDRGPFEERGQCGYQGVLCTPEQEQHLFGVVDLALSFKRTG